MEKVASLSSLALPAVAAFGVFLLPDGTLAEVSEGSYDVGHADRIAGQLIILAAKIRASARRKISAAASD